MGEFKKFIENHGTFLGSCIYIMRVKSSQKGDGAI
jgi:hypothetical protein